MPHVIDDTETLEYTVASPAGDETHTRVPSSFRRGRPHKLTGCGWLFTMLSRRRPQEQHGVRGTQQFELPIDTLARQYPDLYLLSMAGAG